MLAETRRQSILGMLDHTGQVTTDELAERMGVSVETVRRDLHVLEERQQLQRVHGGAVMRQEAKLEAPRHERWAHASDEKRAIAATMCAQIPDNALLFLDLGTTVEQIAHQLAPSFTGTVLTTSLRIAYILSERDSIDVHVAPGKLRTGELSLSGSATVNYLRTINPDIAVISTGAIDPVRGVSDYDSDERSVKEVLLANSASSYVVADSTKFNQVAPYKVCDLNDATYLVTTPLIGDDTITEITTNGGNLLLAL